MKKKTFINRGLSLILSFVLLLSITVQSMGTVTNVSAAPIYTNENLTKHSTFEDENTSLSTGGLPVGSQRGNWHTYSDSVKTKEEAHDSSWSVKLPKNYSSLEQDVPNLQKGVTYLYSVWAKVDKTASGASPRIGVKEYGGDELHLTVTSTEWEKHTIEFTYTGTGDVRLYVYVANAAGTNLYVDDMSLVAKTDISKVEIDNGKISVDFTEDYSGTPSLSDFKANYLSSIEGEIAKELSLTEGNVSEKSIELNFDAIEAKSVEQIVTVNLIYEPDGQTIGVDYVIPASGGEIIEGKLISLNAENGKATAELEKSPTVYPVAEDFKWEYSIDGKEFNVLLTKDFSYDTSLKTININFYAFSGIPSKEQTVKIKATYNNTVVEDIFTVEIGTSQTYYIDSTNGSDDYDGKTPETAFKTIDRLNSITFIPGDKILFKKGETYVGGFQPKGSGAEGYPIVISSYGEGDLPVLKPGADWQIPYLMSADHTVRDPWVNHIIKFYNQEFWEVSDLELYDQTYSETGEETDVFRSGICVSGENAGDLEHFYFDNLIIHGFRGPGTNIGKTSGGIVMNVYRDPDKGAEGQIQTAINDIRITNCEIYDVGRSGVNFLTPWARRDPSDPKWSGVTYGNINFKHYPYKDFYMGNTLIYNVDGDGLIVDNCENAVVENNLVYRTCVRPGVVFGASVGMFNWNSDDTYFQFNEVYGILEAGDAQGIEIDAINDRTWVQYNYVHDNWGGIMMWCNPGSTYPSYDGIVRYNISQNDGVGHGLFDIRSHNFGSEFSNNTVYLKPDVLNKAGDKIRLMGYESSVDIMKFYNNIFYYSGDNPLPANSFADGIIDWRSNIFYNFTNLPVNDDAGNPNSNVDPMFVDPGKGGAGKFAGDVVDLSGYSLKEGSPAIDAGVPIETYDRDYFGNLVSGIPDIGACDSGSISLKVASNKYAIRQATKEITLIDRDKTTVADLISNLVHDEGIKLQVIRGAGTISGSTRINKTDILKVTRDDSRSAEEIIYTFAIDVTENNYIIPVEDITATAGNSQSGEGPENVLDGNTGSLWHTNWEGSLRETHYITFEIDNIYKVDGLTYLPRQDNNRNGTITKYEILVSMDGVQWTAVASGDWANDITLKKASFDEVEAKFIKLVSVSSTSTATAEFTSAAEMRLTGARNFTDNEAPTPPAKVMAEDVTKMSATLTWSASTDNELVEGYIIKKDNEEIAIVGEDLLNYTITGLEAGTEYTFNIYAFDEAGNISEAGSVTFTTEADIPVDPSDLDTAFLEFLVAEADRIIADNELEGTLPVIVDRFNKALKEAKDILAKTEVNPSSVSQTEVDNSAKVLLEVMFLIDFKGDKSKLEKLVTLAETYVKDKEQYTPATYTAFEKALIAASAVLEEENVLQDEIDKAWNDLAYGVARLRKIPNKDILKEILNKVKSLNRSSYTIASFESLEKAEEEAIKVLNYENSTKEDVDTAKDNLIEAMDNLVLVASTTDVTTTKTEGKTNSSAPKTGETSLIMISILVLLLSLLALVISKNHKEKQGF